MHKSFSIENFRCFEDFTVTALKRINLITGKNNVGKTALLEALWLHHGYHNPELGLRLQVFRGLTHFKRDEFMWNLFLGFDPQRKIILSSQDQNGQRHTLSITMHEHATSRVSLRKERHGEESGKELLPTYMLEQETSSSVGTEVRFQYDETISAHAYVETDGIRFERPAGIKDPLAILLVAGQKEGLKTLAERYGNLEVRKETRQIVETLTLIEPRLVGLTVRHIGGNPVIYGDVGAARLMPLPLMGDGVGRLLGIALAIPEAKDGVLLIDEVENGLHHSVMVDVWRALARLARVYNVQIFATTHSAECIYAAHEAFADDEPYEFALHRLEQVAGTIQAVSYDNNTLAAAFEIDVEVR